MALPAAFVLPLGQEAEPNQVWNGLIQIVHKQVGIAVELDAQRDRRGQDPTMSFETIEAQIFASVLNLEIGECRMVRGTSFAGARYLDLDRARLFYQWEFNIDWQLTDADGVQPLSVPLAARRGRYLQGAGSGRRSWHRPRRRRRRADRRSALSAADRWSVAGAT